MRRFAALMAGLIVFLSPLWSLADENIAKLEEVVVTATATKTPVKKLPVNVQIITKDEIERSSADNLGDLLEEKLPGHIHKYPGILTSVGIRGFRTDTHGTDIKGRVLILIDGHRAGTGNVAEIPLENVERIEIVRGPASVIYGSAAMGGVVNIITKKGKGRPSVSAGTEYGSWDYNKQWAKTEGEWGKFNFSASISKAQRNDYKTGNGDEVNNTDYHDWKGAFRIGFTPRQGHEISLTGQLTEIWRVGSPGPSYSPDDNDYKDVRRKYISLAYDAQWNEKISTHVSYYYVQDSSEWHDPDEAYGYFQTKTITNTQGLRLKGIFSLNKLLRITAGADWDGIRTKNAKYPSGTPWSPNAAYDNYAGYLQAEINWNKLYVLAGARYDYWKEELRPTQQMVLRSDEEDYDHITWRTGASYQILPWLKIRVAVGTAFRTPTADEISGRFERSWSRIIGNPDLDPETSTTYEMGFDIIKGSLRAGADYFRTVYEDRIAGGFPTCLYGDCSWTTFKNVDGATLEGIEFYASYDAGELLELPFMIKPYVNGITYTKRKIDDRDYRNSLGDDTVPYVSKWNITGGLDVGIPEKLMANLSFLYVGKQKVQEWNWTDPNYKKAVNKGGFTIFNASLHWKVCKHAKLFLKVNNLFDKEYSFVKYYPMPGRTWRAGVEVTF